MPQLSRCHIYAAAPKHQDALRHMHVAAFTLVVAAFTRPSSRCCIHAVAFTQPLSRGGSAGGRGPLGTHFPSPSATLEGRSREGLGAGGGLGDFFEGGVDGF